MTNKLKLVYIRVDANTQVGLGHLTRTLALVEILKDLYSFIFLIQDPAKGVINKIENFAKISILPKTDDYLYEASYITDNYLSGEEIIVIDGYNFETKYQKILKNKGNILVAIDDLHNWHFVSDVIINHGCSKYSKLYSCEKYSKVYQGLDYALLRKPFLQRSQMSLEINNISSVFICFGGADNNNLSQKFLDICTRINEIHRICIVVGAGFRYNIGNYINSISNKKVELYRDIEAEQMVNVMGSCQLAIVPASSLAIEAYAVKIFILTGMTADNQYDIHSQLIKYNGVRSVGNLNETNDSVIIDTIYSFIHNKIELDFGIINSVRNIKNIFKSL